MKKIIFPILMVTLFFSCAENESKINLPYITSYGNLVRIEKKDSMLTSNTPKNNFSVQMMFTSTQMIIPKTDEVLYLLSFEGKKEIKGVNKGESNKDQVSLDFSFGFPLIDKNNQEFLPVYTGYINAAGALTKDSCEYSMQIGDTGIIIPVLVLPQPKLYSLYLVPKKSSKLLLKDGERKFSIN